MVRRRAADGGGGGAVRNPASDTPNADSAPFALSLALAADKAATASVVAPGL
jgi:hypothetical protein